MRGSPAPSEGIRRLCYHTVTCESGAVNRQRLTPVVRTLSHDQPLLERLAHSKAAPVLSCARLWRRRMCTPFPPWPILHCAAQCSDLSRSLRSEPVEGMTI